MNRSELWERYTRYLCAADEIGLRVDISRMKFDDSHFARMAEPMDRALKAMAKLEAGAIANIDERRMVGHYWLRNPDLAPEKSIGADIQNCIASVERFADDVQNGVVLSERGEGFFVVLVIGIGGSALGPQFFCDCFGGEEDRVVLRFLDNSDPDGIERTINELRESLSETLTIVVSKSGTTTETINAMHEAERAYREAGLRFSKHAVAVTREGTPLHRRAVEEKWLKWFPLWDWVGGRTSAFSAAGLLPAALLGIDVQELLAGARICDIVTRRDTISANPAALLALMWHHAGKGRGEKNMVVLPYRDRLQLFGRYLQQLVMESLGKELDRAGNVVRHGLTVYGNKGTTDQHAFMQQLRDGRDDFFVTFLEVLRDRATSISAVAEGATTGDSLHAFLHGTRSALTEKGRESITITLDELSPHRIGALIALFERAVGLYAELIDVNAYHQPGVEAGKSAAADWMELKKRVLHELDGRRGVSRTVSEIADALGQTDRIEDVFHILEYAASNPETHVRVTRSPGFTESRYDVGK